MQALQQRNEQLTRLALTHALTQLPNRERCATHYTACWRGPSAAATACRWPSLIWTVSSVE